MSGFATLIVFLPCVICLLLWSIALHIKIFPLVLVAVFARALSGRLFWNLFFASRMDRDGFKDWKASVNYSFLNQPYVIKPSIAMIADYVVDMLLVYIALRRSIAPIWIFLPFVACQTISALVWGIISDLFNRITCLQVSLVVTMLAVLIMYGVNKGLESGTLLSSFINLVGLHHFTASTQIVIILCIKGLFSCTTIIARAVIADTIYIEAERNNIRI